MTREDLRQEVLFELRALSTANDIMNNATASFLGIHVTDMHAGEVLDRKGPMTIGELAREVGLSPGAATALVDRLEAAGLATRVHDLTNRRRILVRPSKEAQRRAAAVFGPLIRQSRALLSHFSDEELLLIRDFLRQASGIVTERAMALASADSSEGESAGAASGSQLRRAGNN